MVKPVRVLIVDDSALIRKLLTRIFESDSGMEVVGTASNPYIARDLIKQLDPDVITLDVEMPRMDGITFLSNLMRLRPTPVVMISTLTQKGAQTTLKALELGAVDFVGKPVMDGLHTIEQYGKEICSKVKAAAAARAHLNSRFGNTAAASAPVKRVSGGYTGSAGTLIAIGASTGGTEAIKRVISAMPETAPPIVITQHIPAAFSGPFAERVNKSSVLNVSEAQDGQEIQRGHVYIAPGDRHLEIVRNGTRICCRLDDGPPVNRHKPSVDVLFHSVAKVVGHNSVGVLLTGMGNDGAAGLKAMQDSRALTIAQDQDTSVVWGMPGSAVKLQAADKILPLDSVANAALKLAS